MLNAFSEPQHGSNLFSFFIAKKSDRNFGIVDIALWLLCFSLGILSLFWSEIVPAWSRIIFGFTLILPSL